MWSDPITSINPKIDPINNALKEYNIAYKSGTHKPEHLEKIIKACHGYLQQININLRNEAIFNSEKRTIILSEHPELLQVLSIQKQAVIRMQMPKAKTESEALEMLGRELMHGEKSDKFQQSSGTKMLDENYWKEFAYKGKLSTVRWIENDDDFRSYYEVREQKLSVQDIDPTYLEKPDEKKVILSPDGTKLLYASSNRFVSPGEYIFVVGPDNSIYVHNIMENIRTQKFQHSSFLRGSPVICAGTMRVFAAGYYDDITLMSGHYRPGKQELGNFLIILRDIYGVDLKNIKYVRDKESTQAVSAEEYLAKVEKELVIHPKDDIKSSVKESSETTIYRQLASQSHASPSQLVKESVTSQKEVKKKEKKDKKVSKKVKKSDLGVKKKLKSKDSSTDKIDKHDEAGVIGMKKLKR